MPPTPPPRPISMERLDQLTADVPDYLAVAGVSLAEVQDKYTVAAEHQLGIALMDIVRGYRNRSEASIVKAVEHLATFAKELKDRLTKLRWFKSDRLSPMYAAWRRLGRGKWSKVCEDAEAACWDKLHSDLDNSTGNVGHCVVPVGQRP